MSNKESSLYTTPGGEPVRTLEEWTKRYTGKTWKEIVSELPRSSYLFGLIKPYGGPRPSWRYVQIPGEQILDMRHVLVMGMKYGRIIGVLVELGQYIFDRKSANQLQDYYSNNLGKHFLRYLSRHSEYFKPPNSFRYGCTNDRELAIHFANFIKREWR